ncbi:MAG TPA: ADP-ribose diphosphatase, partial [Aeromicrobium sp.]|nr:ADP-ribose diphosphatase [Aeromicrobium sp.]
DVTAEVWEEIFGLATTPGYSAERLRLFRASGLNPVPHDQRVERHAEEADLEQWWMPLDDAVDAIFAGRICDSRTAAVIMAEVVRRQRLGSA